MQMIHNLALKDTPSVALNAPACIATHRLARRPARKAAETRISDMDLEAYVDGEADANLSREVERAIMIDSALRRRANELRDQKRLLQLWWKQFS